MPSHLRRTIAKGNEYPLLVDRIFAGWYEAAAAESVAPNCPTVDDSVAPSAQQGFSEPEFHTGDPFPGEIEELKRLGVAEDRILEMWGRFSPERIAKILGVTVSQVRIAAAWNRRTAPPVSVATCTHCGTAHPPRLQSLDHQAVCSEICQIERNALLEAAQTPQGELTESKIISGALNADTVRALLVPSQNRLPRDAVAAPNWSI